MTFPTLVAGGEDGELWRSKWLAGDRQREMTNMDLFHQSSSLWVSRLLQYLLVLILHLSARCLAEQLHAQLHPLGFSATEQIARDLAFYPPNHSTIIETFTTNLFLVLCFLRKRECNSSEKPRRVSNLRPLQSKVDVQLAQTWPWMPQRRVNVSQRVLCGTKRRGNQRCFSTEHNCENRPVSG